MAHFMCTCGFVGCPISHFRFQAGVRGRYAHILHYVTKVWTESRAETDLQGAEGKLGQSEGPLVVWRVQPLLAGPLG